MKKNSWSWSRFFRVEPAQHVPSEIASAEAATPGSDTQFVRRKCTGVAICASPFDCECRECRELQHEITGRKK